MNKLIGIILLFFFIRPSLGQIIENSEYSDLYLYQCSSSSGINICYPEREVNPHEIIAQAREENLDLDPTPICEDMYHGNEQDVMLCVSMMRQESDIAHCDILFPDYNDEENQICRNLAVTHTSLSELIDTDLITCEADFQEAVRAHFTDDFPGLNISFSSGVSEVDYIHNASISSFTDFSNDILLLPEHENNAFCNEDGEFSLNDLDRRLEVAKDLIMQYHSDAGISDAVDVLNAPTRHVPIVSTTCPGLDGTYKAEKIGEHRDISPRVKQRTATPEEDEDNSQIDEKNKCIESNATALFNYHDKQVAEFNSSQQGNNFFSSPYQGAITSIPYSVMGVPTGLGARVKMLCDEIGTGLQINNGGVFIDGKQVPKLPTYEYGHNSEPGVVNDMARSFKEEINTSRVEDEEDLLPDGTYVLDLMEIQYYLSKIQKAKIDAERVAEPGNTFSSCGGEWIEIAQENTMGMCMKDNEIICMEIPHGSYLDEDCNVLEFNSNSSGDMGMYDADLVTPSSTDADTGYEDFGDF